MTINKPKSLAFIVFFIALLYPPLVFYGFMNDTLRIVLFAFVLMTLFLSQTFRIYKKHRAKAILTCWVIFLVYTIGAIYANRNGTMRSTLGYAMILLFAIFVYTIMKSEGSEIFNSTLLKLYTSFFKVVAISTIINFFLNMVAPSINILTPYLAENPYHYEISPFGLSVAKPIFGVNIARSFFFFIEPVFLALFYLVNVFVIGPTLEHKRKGFIRLNIIGGVVTFSYLFFAGYLIIKALKMRTFYKVLTISLVVLFYLAFQNSILSGISETSSIDNRVFRIETALQFIQSIGIQKVLFGLGIEYDYISDFGINAGILSTVIENGIFGLFFLLTIMLLFAQRNTLIIIIIFLGLLTVEPFKLPLFWLTVVLAGEIARRHKNLQPNSDLLVN